MTEKTAAAPAAAPKRGGRTRAAESKPEPSPVASAPAAPGERPPEPPEPPKAEDKPADPPAASDPPKDPPAADPVIDNPAPNENDCEFVLRIFGVPPAKYMKDGALDRAALQFDLDTRRHLFANRVLHRRSGA